MLSLEMAPAATAMTVQSRHQSGRSPHTPEKGKVTRRILSDSFELEIELGS